MKMTDNKGKLFGIINIVDLLIILLVAVVAVVGYKFFANTVTNVEEQRMRLMAKLEEGPTQLVTMEITAQRESLCKNIKIGEEVINVDTNIPYGVIKAVSYKPAEENAVSNIDGTVKKVIIPERFDATVVLEVPGDEIVHVGKRLSVKTKHFVSGGFVLAIEEVEAE